MRIAVLFDDFGPYHVARMVAAASVAEVIAVEANPARGEYTWERPIIPAPLVHVPLCKGGGSTRAIGGELDLRLAPLSPSAIALPGWSSRATLAALDWSARRGIPAIVMSESNGWDQPRRGLDELVKRRIVRHYSAGLVTSDSQAGYLTALGLPAGRIFRGYNAVDNSYFEEAAGRASAGPMPSIDGEPLPERWRGRYFLVSCRLIEKKNLERLFHAYARFSAGRGGGGAEWPLVIVGDGPLRAALEHLITTLRLSHTIRLAGFRQIEELPSFYGTAGGLIHPSTTEQWGLVVNEAMASGLPVAVSSRCGCAEVLVEDGVSGIVFDPFDEDAIVRALELLVDRDRASAFAVSGRTRIAAWGPERFAQGLLAAANTACAHPARPSRLDRAVLAGLTLRGDRAASRAERR